jgi:signal transduction histidine kinase
VPARLCLRGGFQCFNRIAQAMGIEVPDEPDPRAGISLSYQEFLDAVTRMREVDFPIERDPEEAWPDFVGWRINYERAAYAVAAAVEAVPALWSGPRLGALRRRSVLPVKLDLRTERRLPEPVEVAAYYVVSEALTNSAKHAHASVVNVELHADDAILRLAIRDDGIGGADPQGSGLLGLRDRIHALGGTLQVTSPAGQGTTLLIEVPLDDHASA